ncbi:MAG: EscU/YscU/HrcU family type III secretion system export apparatus switch protein [Gammaproteobacteria bacterium]|nr:EscU/YscU/HrcU family type III secretion system export apparatus switch protein [Gammaproteobacteria bacterium]MDH5731152.1 EscU/YscU/HrcU family type III secretion system export apparatus switch protein [Gammaproteobacteria bacterium]
MAEESQDEEKTEQATPFRLQEAKKRGQVPKSQEFNSLFVLSAGLFILVLLSDTFTNQFFNLNRKLLTSATDFALDTSNSVQLLALILENTFQIFWPLTLLFFVVAIIMNLVQTGPIFSFHPLKPDINRLHPIKGFKRVFSKRMIYETGKTLLKLGLFAMTAALTLHWMLPRIFSVMQVDPHSHFAILLRLSFIVLIPLVLVFVLIAIIDLVYSRLEFAKKMRMSHRDIKEEFKRREGDPHIKSKRKQIQAERLKQVNAVANVKKADVLITNPTHIAIALIYDSNAMNAPKVVAKGAGELAQKMKHIAYRFQVPIVEDKPLARQLFRDIEIEQTISSEYFSVVARILARIYTTSTNQQH